MTETSDKSSLQVCVLRPNNPVDMLRKVVINSADFTRFDALG